MSVSLSLFNKKPILPFVLRNGVMRIFWAKENVSLFIFTKKSLSHVQMVIDSKYSSSSSSSSSEEEDEDEGEKEAEITLENLSISSSSSSPIWNLSLIHI